MMQPLCNDQIRRLAPAAFATQPHPRTSSRYRFLPTSDVINAFRDVGLYPVSAQSARVRRADFNGFQRHLIRFRRLDTVTHIGQVIPEVILYNNHLGSGWWELIGGLFRTVCLNGLVVSDLTIPAIKVSHRGRPLPELVEGAVTVALNTVRAVDLVDEMSDTYLPQRAQLRFADAASRLRWDSPPVDPASLLGIRRPQDEGDDVWRVMNRVQEALVRGGNAYLHHGKDNVVSLRQTRRVTGLSKLVEINRGVWQLAQDAMKEAA